MTDVLEKRLTDLETLVWELPDLLNTRMTRFEAELVALRAGITDNSSCVAALEKTMVGLQTNIRDMRGGVTHQLSAQDKRLSDMDQRLSGLAKQASGGLAEVDKRLLEQDQKLDLILDRLPPA